VQHLNEDPPDVVLVVDADCRVAPGSVDMLSSTARLAHRPAQALYLMTAPHPASVTERASEFAWRIKNQTRPLGLHVLRLPCQLMGSGMAFPWQLISNANLATGHIVEDLNLGIELAAQGHPPMFCPKARVTSTFPMSAKAAENQRYRWEHGHVRVLTSAGPRLALLALRRGDIKVLALALDLLIPPLGLLGFLNLSMLVLSGGLWLVGAAPYAFVMALISFILMFASIAISWWSNGRDLLAASDLPLALGYLASKIGLYRKLFSGRGVASWVRTDRGDR
jgi:cellulose synthase/poly-beta-1,6-N-acetylglucosamine synthase-like glycosyltransferase